MEAIRLHEIVKKDGEILVTGLPCKKGQDVEMILNVMWMEGEEENVDRKNKDRGIKIKCYW